MSRKVSKKLPVVFRIVVFAIVFLMFTQIIHAAYNEDVIGGLVISQPSITVADDKGYNTVTEAIAGTALKAGDDVYIDIKVPVFRMCGNGFSTRMRSGDKIKIVFRKSAGNDRSNIYWGSGTSKTLDYFETTVVGSSPIVRVPGKVLSVGDVSDIYGIDIEFYYVGDLFLYRTDCPPGDGWVYTRHRNSMCWYKKFTATNPLKVFWGYNKYFHLTDTNVYVQ